MIPTDNTNFNQEAFERGLQEWVAQTPVGSDENRQEAARRILECKNTGSQSLNLKRFRLTTLPAEIGNLARLKKLNLSQNQLTNIPTEIVNLTQLEELSLSNNQITNIPAEITNLAQLRTLYLGGNQLTTIPTEIANLTQLQELNLGGNQLTTLPTEIANLTQLEGLYLDYNQLTTIPDSLFQTNGRSLVIITLQANRVTQPEAQRLNQLAQNSGVTFEVSIYREPNVWNANSNPAQQQNIINAIIDKAPEEQKAAVTALFYDRDQNPTIFSQFVSECSRTAGWRENNDQMLNALTSLFCDISKKESLETKCLAIASTAFGTCGDRVALAYTQMLMAQNSEQMPVAEMNLAQLSECARKEDVTKFLNEKAKNKLLVLRTQAGAFDEIETYLAYLQIAPQLGLELPNSAMLYRACANVSNQELEEAVNEFKSVDLNSRIANHIYQDPELRKHPQINKLINEIRNDPQFSDEKLDTENEHEHSERLKNVGVELEKQTLSEITALVSEARTTANAQILRAEEIELTLVTQEEMQSTTPQTEPSLRRELSGNLLQIASSISARNTSSATHPNDTNQHERSGNSR